MVKRGWIEYSESVEVLEKRVCDFFSLRTIEEQPSFFRAIGRPTSYTETTPSQRAWLFRAWQMAREIKASGFSKQNLEGALQDLKKLLDDPTKAQYTTKILLEAGIRFLVVEALPGTKIDGACFWIDETSPVITLSLRFDRMDNFWYILAHELEHTKRGVQALYVDIERKGNKLPDIEIAANEFADHMA